MEAELALTCSRLLHTCDSSRGFGGCLYSFYLYLYGNCLHIYVCVCKYAMNKSTAFLTSAAGDFIPACFLLFAIVDFTKAEV